MLKTLRSGVLNTRIGRVGTLGPNSPASVSHHPGDDLTTKC
jgi:hypothetical protein